MKTKMILKGLNLEAEVKWKLKISKNAEVNTSENENMNLNCCLWPLENLMCLLKIPPLFCRLFIKKALLKNNFSELWSRKGYYHLSKNLCLQWLLSYLKKTSISFLHILVLYFLYVRILCVPSPQNNFRFGQNLVCGIHVTLYIFKTLFHRMMNICISITWGAF